ncbi:GNAT family N-acetyltransferase [Eionea flava]
MKKEFTLAKIQESDHEYVVTVIAESNAVVAEQFGISRQNNPKHPSFYTQEWLASDIARGEQYFVCRQGERVVACVAFEHPRPDTAYLNRLSVLPAYQRQGIGKMLVEYIVSHAEQLAISTISIGIIAAHLSLKSWYISLGFEEGETKEISHLPFDVTYLRLYL